jgi:hypothetical protein
MALLNIAILVLVVICVIGALLSLFNGLQERGSLGSAAYGVGRQESRRSMQVAFLRAGVFGIVALILLGVYGLRALPDDMLSADPEPEATLSPTATVEEEATEPVVAPATEVPASEDDESGTEIELPTATATNAAPTATATVAATPTITPTPEPSAVVNSEVGLYLRPEPGSSVEVELLANGTELLLLPERETVDDVEWQHVRAPSGNEGWVAVDFITYQQ